ncbi:protein STICHEL-like 2 [Solanum dulcamara]|uniref:protein STICHEL-like 2 n=1 Tax=Solanum dulcamara TaxID=45834 RepID=UPI0024850405|nr:protein STICHEL-like 2 [Solanum dulcamara]XP_055828465.1 protein STICHEL-like 2 [Solanum dulcamara]XP_055828466.1 protein STICHEL-like 2 [Solanum dulcamara]
MDGRRHSVDVPISKTLVALRRVKSLRDPTTNSISKFSTMVDHSSNAITLGFENRQEVGYNEDSSALGQNGFVLYANREEYAGDQELNCNMGNFKSQLVSPQMELWNGNVEMSNICQPNEMERGNRSSSKRLGHPYRDQGMAMTCTTPSNAWEEGNGSSKESNEGAVQAKDAVYYATKKNCKHKKHTRSSRTTAGDVLGRLGSPYFSVSDAPIESSNHVISLYGNEDVDNVESDHGGCGISSCWLGTPKFRGSSPLTHMEERPLLSAGIGERLLALQRRSSAQDNNGIASHSESPRNLSQKFRPKSFSEMVGQNVVSRSLSNAISSGRINPFYLFHGPRGTGKTCASRIFAAALNCLSPDAERPCGLCRDCVLYFSGRSRDVKEVDSLKINKMERVRLLVKNALTPPVSSKFKIFIIDECHFLREETWTRILNHLEELSRNVIFIMITPDLDKLPRSAVSLSQKYHFSKIKEVDISNRLHEICEDEGIDFNQDALDFIACKSNGSLRDGEIMLEQLSLLGKRITMPLVYELIGAVSDDELLELLHLALSSDTSNTVKRARELMRSRIDPMQLVSQLANLIMDILAGKCQRSTCEVKDRLFSEHISEAEKQQLGHALKVLSETEKQLRMSKNQTTWLTAALLQLSSAGSSVDTKDGNSCLRMIYEQDPDGHPCSTSSTSESLKHLTSCACESMESCKRGMQDDKETLASIWYKTTEICESNSLANLLRRGKLSSICLKQGLAIAELEFYCPKDMSKAEKLWKPIANALKRTLCCNVEIRVSLVPGWFPKKYSRVKRLSYRLFNCSFGKPHSKMERRIDASENSDSASKRVIMVDKVVETCSSECLSQNSQICCHGREIMTIRNSDGNALSIGSDTPQILLTDGSLQTHQLETDCLKERSTCRCRDLFTIESEKKPSCFPRTVGLLKRSRSSNASHMTFSITEPQSNLVLSIPCKTPCQSHNPCSSLNNRSSGNPDLSKESRSYWRTALLPFRKALQLRHQHENQPQEWILPYSAAN